jgi:8-oxo-dGTP pyrophosphatase MutT (NUDIX family)
MARANYKQYDTPRVPDVSGKISPSAPGDSFPPKLWKSKKSWGGDDTKGWMYTRYSFGIILTRVNPQNNRPEAVLVRGRYSYEYAEFVHGRYSRKNLRGVRDLLDAMSVNERLDLFSLNFKQMWYRIWLTADRQELYNRKLSKFQTTWMKDDSGKYLRKLVQESQTDPGSRQQRGGGIRWEFPKGRRRFNQEPDINCAVREFEEESGIAKRDYQILPDFRRRASFVHMGVRYVTVYYVAVTRRDIQPRIDLRDMNQVAEVSEVRWMDIEQIRLIDTPTKRLETTVGPVFKYVKKYFRGRMSLRSLPEGKVLLRSLEKSDVPGGKPKRDLARRQNCNVGLAPRPRRRQKLRRHASRW